MATDKTPDYKRIQRAEAGREEWKMKALLRREECEKLKIQLKFKESQLIDQIHQDQKQKEQLVESNRKIAKLEKQVENLKKKCR